MTSEASAPEHPTQALENSDFAADCWSTLDELLGLEALAANDRVGVAGVTVLLVVLVASGLVLRRRTHRHNAR